MRLKHCFVAPLILLMGVCLTACGGDTAEADGGEKAPLAMDATYQTISWDDLSAVKFEDRYYEDLNEYLLYPTFEPSVQQLDGAAVRIEGYVIPVEPGRYVLSANPFSSCFFCGGAGPETVLELALVAPEVVFFTDDFKTFVGTLKLNDSDVDKLNYILEDALVE